MTYCLAIQVQSGIVFAADSRTNAGVDHVSTYSKIYAFSLAGDRVVVLLSSGNLATTQSVVNHLHRELTSRTAQQSLKSIEHMFDIAQHVGEVSCAVQSRHQGEETNEAVNMQAHFILGGQIAGQPPEIYLIYPQGNYISASNAKPYLQVGETKYGKPILDRIIRPETSLEDAARCALISLDSTARSNVSVGPPFELIFYRTETCTIQEHIVLEGDSPLYAAFRNSWSDGLKNAFKGLPRFEWESRDQARGTES